MPKTKTKKVPGLLKHSSGQGRVYLSGRFHYCGVYGTAAAAQRYADLVAKWEANGRKPLAEAADVEQVRPLQELFVRYEQFLDSTGRYRKDGRPTSQRDIVAVAIREFVETFGNTPITRFSDALLLQHRDSLEKRVELTRVGINRKIGLLRAAVRWLYSRGLVARDAWLGVSAIVPLSRAEAGNRDRRRRKRAVTFEEVQMVAACLPRVPAAMLMLQALVGLRPGEVCSMRWRDIDRTPVVVDGVACWTYTVAASKSSHHGKETRYPLAPRAQAILRPFQAPPDAWIFSPRQTMKDLHDQARDLRRTPITKQTRQRDSAEHRQFEERYDVATYRQAIERGVKKAKVTSFTPHEVRHGFVTRAAQRFGVFAASVAANHSRVQTTEAYLHRDPIEAFKVAAGFELAGTKQARASRRRVKRKTATVPDSDEVGVPAT